MHSQNILRPSRTLAASSLPAAAFGLALLISVVAASAARADVAPPAPAVPGATAVPAPPAPAPKPPATGPGFGPSASNAQYKINGGDSLAVTVYGEKDLPQAVTVLPDGDIDYPLAGRVHVGGLTPSQAERVLTQALSRYIRHPVVTISVTQEGQINVLVLGNVKTPGKYQLPAGSHATDAIAAAGGLGPINGDYPMSRVADSSGNVRQLDLQKILHDGDTGLNIGLSDQSTVYVPSPNTFNVEVFGSVGKPGDVQLNEGDRLAMAIARAGPDAAMNPDLNNIQIRRTDSSGKTQTITVNLYEVLKSGDESKDVPMQKNDIVFVPQSKTPVGKQLSNSGPVIWALSLLMHL